MKTTFAAEFALAARQGPRLFFAPLVGAINAIRFEARRIALIHKAGADLPASSTTKHS